MHDKASAGLGVAVMIVAGWGIVGAIAWPWKAALFPLVIAIPLFCLAAAEVLLVLLGPGTRTDGADFKMSDHLPQSVVLRRTAVAAGWILGFFAAILLLGFLAAVPLFMFLYLKLQGKEGWVFSVLFTAAVWVFFYGLFDLLLHLPFPPGWIQSLLGLG